MCAYSLDDYDFTLPSELIAQQPTPRRDDSRLLVCDCRRDSLADRRFPELLDLLAPGDLLVFNDTKVFPARLTGVKESGGKVELFLLEYPRPATGGVAGGVAGEAGGVAGEAGGVAGATGGVAGATGRVAGATGASGAAAVVSEPCWALLKSSKRPKVGGRLLFGPDFQAEVLELADGGKARVRLEVSVQQHRTFGRSARLKYTGYEAPGCGPCQSSANSRQSAALLNAYVPLTRQFDAPGERVRLGLCAAAGTVSRGLRSLDDAMEHYGQMPLPPYIKREGEDRADRRRYQTVYAQTTGAVAAPTAGLHFTEELLAAVAARGVRQARVTLHVGYGTFAPVRCADIRHHPIHAEDYLIGKECAALVNQTKAAGGRIWAVGTTSVRALESAADPEGVLRPGEGRCDLYIYPGYRFRVVENLLTNFHLPKSSLLFLVSALAGHDRIMAAYHHAVAARYRFFSYGDAMAIITR